MCGVPPETAGLCKSIRIPVLVAVTGMVLMPKLAQTRLFMPVTFWTDEKSQKQTVVFRWMRRISEQPFKLSENSEFLFFSEKQLLADINALYKTTTPIRCIEIVVSMYPTLVIFPVKTA